jgi:tetraacyldisaccharide 4'-kinase
MTIALAKALEARGLRVDILSRGYGRRGVDPARVALEGTAEQFGDEPLLIARETGAPVYVAAQRYEAGLLAEANASKNVADDQRPVVHLLDDGFQHRQLARDADILLIGRQDWEDILLPAGNLREPLKALRRASVIAIPAEDPQLEVKLRDYGWDGPVWRLRRQVDVPAIDGPVVGFCGIARPEQFFAGVEAAGLPIAARLAFPDHHRYAAADLNRIAAEAKRAGALTAITTEKDQVRLGMLSSALPQSLQLKTVQLRVEIEPEGEAVDWLVARIRGA